MTTPLLLLSDNPLGNTGLGRVTGQIAKHIHERLPDVFRVGVAGIGGGSAQTPYPVYGMPPDYGAAFPYVLREHFKGECGIVFTILNAEWVNWLAEPETLPFGDLRETLLTTKMKKWCYVPVDAESIGGKLPASEIQILSKFDRVLAYTEFGSKLIGHGLHALDSWQVPWRIGPIPHLPHGTDSTIFYPRSRAESRKMKFGPKVLKRAVSLDMDTMLLGVVATNSLRKDWPLAFETLAELLARGVNAGMWVHTNQVSGTWGDLVNMAVAFGVRDSIQFTSGGLSDEDLAWAYAACDVVLGIGSGGGWEMPLSEALACGIPVVTGDYAGVTEFVPVEYRIYPWAWRYDQEYFCRRPVFRVSDWADRILWAKGTKIQLDSKFTWEGCWNKWSQWLKEGIQ